MPPNRGSCARARATASAGVSGAPPGVAAGVAPGDEACDGAGAEGELEAVPQPATTRAATTMAAATVSVPSGPGGRRRLLMASRR